MSQVPVASRPLVYQLIGQVTAGVTPRASSTAEMYTALGRQKLDTPEMFQRIVDEAKSTPPYWPQDPGLVAEPLHDSPVKRGLLHKMDHCLAEPSHDVSTKAAGPPGHEEEIVANVAIAKSRQVHRA